MAVSLDGVMVPMKDGAHAAKRRTKGPTKGAAGYQEVGRASISFYDADGERGVSTLHMARMPEANEATLKTSVAAHAHALLAQRLELTVADGERDNWTVLPTLVPEGEERVDFFHTVEQVKAAFDAADGENDP